MKLKRRSSSYETDQGKQPRIVFIDRCQNSRPTCSPIEEQASGAIGSDDVSANPQSMHKIIDRQVDKVENMQPRFGSLGATHFLTLRDLCLRTTGLVESLEASY